MCLRQRLTAVRHMTRGQHHLAIQDLCRQAGFAHLFLDLTGGRTPFIVIMRTSLGLWFLDEKTPWLLLTWLSFWVIVQFPGRCSWVGKNIWVSLNQLFQKCLSTANLTWCSATLFIKKKAASDTLFIISRMPSTVHATLLLLSLYR